LAVPRIHGRHTFIFPSAPADSSTNCWCQFHEDEWSQIELEIVGTMNKAEVRSIVRCSWPETNFPRFALRLSSWSGSGQLAAAADARFVF
jgi:hypothetical protein